MATEWNALRTKKSIWNCRTAREDPCCTLHRQYKQRRGEEITNSPNAGSLNIKRCGSSQQILIFYKHHDMI